MRVLIDTNILISAALSSQGTPFQAFVKAVTYPNHGLVCEQNIDEMRRIFNRKFPKKIAALEKFLSLALMTLEMVPTPIIYAKADVLLTGDKDFLESGIENPKIMTATEFVQSDIR